MSLISDNYHSHPTAALRSLEASCAFMSMAINRSIDFAKASGNIALVLTLETFNIVEALSVPINVIKHLQVNAYDCRVVSYLFV